MEPLARRLEAWGQWITRYGLVLVLLWIGGMKFTPFEANATAFLVARSPLLSWIYRFLSVQTFSNALGVLELGVALLLALRPLSAKASAIGSALAAGLFLTTLTFLFSTPGWESTPGFPILGTRGQFLLKDIVLLGASVWSLGESLRHVSVQPQ
ncbi:MAG: DUF417 family protein [Ktedonobacteraceae bacterium]|nr:DUF417 family protein [Ktedonobacteraceae bacterium]